VLTIATAPIVKTRSVVGTTNGAAIQSNDRTGVKPKPMSAKLNRMGECIFTKDF
jgi:hypothetical protein